MFIIYVKACSTTLKMALKLVVALLQPFALKLHSKKAHYIE
jgi:hypothetical protein